MDSIPTITKCNTCKAAFSSVELVREHYKTDWHVFNSKRRANNLGHVTLEEYRKQYPVKKSNTTKTPANTTERSTNNKVTQVSNTPIVTKTTQTVTSTPSKPTTTKATSETTEISTTTTTTTTTIETVAIESINLEGIPVENTHQSKSENYVDVDVVTKKLEEFALQLGVESDRVNTIVATALASEGQVDDEDGDEEEREDENKEEEDDEDEPILIEPNVSIFDDKEFRTVDACVQYMEKTFGFFIPEREYLIDLPGFLVYLGEKVKIGGICLYCQKQFTPGRPCQNHMMSKSHCKIAYQEDVDEDEFEDFYDFSTSYGQNQKKRSGNDDGDDNNDDEEEEEDDLVDDTLEISPLGELILTDGRTVGHRAFRKYYRQKHKPMDNRLSVTAQRREEAHKFQSRFQTDNILHLSPGTLNGMDLRRLSDTEIMTLLVKKHKEMRRMQQIEQRLQRRQEYRHHRAEYLSVKDQLRARINRTDKIRDYHGMLM